MISYLFFFSSRRRHTRSLCDWSSDVCSSDLFAGDGARIDEDGDFWLMGRVDDVMNVSAKRSEERRVGKECRARMSLYNKKKKQIKGQSGLGTIILCSS